MNETKLTTIGQIREFLTGTADVYWMPGDDDKARYAFIRNVLSRFNYHPPSCIVAIRGERGSYNM